MLPVYTELLRVERRVWHIGRWPLPRPITLPQLGISLIVFGVLFWAFQHGLLAVPAPPLGPMLVGFYLMAGVAAVWVIGQPVLDGRTGAEVSGSLLRHAAEPRFLIRLGPVREPRQVRLRLWTVAWRDLPCLPAPQDDRGGTR